MALTVDQMLRQIGQFGPYQIRILVMFMFMFIPITFQTLIMVFVAYEPPWMCSTAFKRNESTCLLPNQSASEIYDSSSTKYTRRCNLERDQWKFADGHLFDGPQQTIITSFDLVCDKGYLATLANSILYLGWAFGAIVLGTVADKYGRRSVLFPCTFGVIVVTFSMAFSYTYWPIVICRCLIGFCLAGCFLSMFVLATELVGPQKRALAGTLVWFFFTGALMLMGLTAYFVRNWKTVCIICSAPWIFVIVFMKFIPESVRWLLVQGRKEEARAILEHVAKVNKKEMPVDNLIVPIVLSNKGFLELFKTRKLTIVSLILNYAWFVNGMVYYGLSLSSGEFGGSIYLNFILTSLVEIPGNLLVIHNCNRFGRRMTVVVHMIVAGIFTLIVSAIPAGTTNAGYIAGRVTGGTIGKLCITVSFNALYVFAAELFPTMVRNTGMGMVSVVSRLGAALSPFIVQLTRTNAVLPFAIMGILSFIAAGLSWFLPETKGKPTLETMDDIGKEDEIENLVGLDPKSGSCIEVASPEMKDEDVTSPNDRGSEGENLVT